MKSIVRLSTKSKVCFTSKFKVKFLIAIMIKHTKARLNYNLVVIN